MGLAEPVFHLILRDPEPPQFLAKLLSELRQPVEDFFRDGLLGVALNEFRCGPPLSATSVQCRLDEHDIRARRHENRLVESLARCEFHNLVKMNTFGGSISGTTLGTLRHARLLLRP
jgi:hypothetical protein